MIIGDMVHLRALQRSDQEKTIKWRNDFELKHITMSHPYPVTQETESQWYDTFLAAGAKDRIYFAVCMNETSELIGYVFLYDVDLISRHCFWGGLIGASENRGRGLGREAVSLILQYAFNNLNMHKVYAHVKADHPALKTWCSIGAVIEGTMKDHFWHGTHYHDVLLLAWYS